MKYISATYRVKPDKLAEILAVIREFVDKIRAHEPDTLRYESLQGEEDPCAFTHLMIFANSAAEKRHESTDYLKTFVTKLYPCCETPPRFAEWKLIATARSGNAEPRKM